MSNIYVLVCMGTKVVDASDMSVDVTIQVCSGTTRLTAIFQNRRQRRDSERFLEVTFVQCQISPKKCEDSSCSATVSGCLSPTG